MLEAVVSQLLQASPARQNREDVGVLACRIHPTTKSDSPICPRVSGPSRRGEGEQDGTPEADLPESASRGQCNPQRSSTGLEADEVVGISTGLHPCVDAEDVSAMQVVGQPESPVPVTSGAAGLQCRNLMALPLVPIA